MKEVDDYDVHVGTNLRKFRRARGLNQGELAALVADRGVPFRQQTIVKIEKGERPLRLREADVLALALDVDLDALVGAELTVDWASLLIRHTRELGTRWEELAQNAERFLTARADLATTMAEVTVQGIAIESHIMNEAATLMQVDALDVVKDAAQQVDTKLADDAASQAASARYVLHKRGPADGEH